MEGPKRKKDCLIQPTLSSFMSLRSGLVETQSKAEPKTIPSEANKQGPKGKGLDLVPATGSSESFGEGDRGPRRILEGSPEHHLLKEAKMIKTGEGSKSGPKEASQEEGDRVKEGRIRPKPWRNK